MTITEAIDRIELTTQRLGAAVGDFVAAQSNEIAAREAVRLMTEARDDAVFNAEWPLADQFVTEGNKTFFVGLGGTLSDARRQVTADEKRAVIAQIVKADPDVKQANADLHRAEEAVAKAAADKAAASLRATAIKHSLDAHVAVLNVLSLTATTGALR